MRKPLIICTASVAIGMLAPVAMAAETKVATLDNPGKTEVAAGDTLIVTGNVTSTGDSTSARFDKQGAGTLVLQGDNSFKRIKHSAGKLVFDGGATTVSGGTGAGQVGDGGNFFLDGDEVVITGGANVKIGAAGKTGEDYQIFRAVSTVITNGTFESTVNTSHMLCNFKNSTLPLKTAGQTVTIGEGGRFRVWKMRPFQPGNDASSYKDKYGFNIVDGGILELVGLHPLRIENKHYGFVHFDGGVLANVASGDSVVPCHLSGVSVSSEPMTIVPTAATAWSNARLSVGAGGAVISNAVSKNLYLPVPFQHYVSNGDKDGGLHFSGKGTTYLYATGATFNGGTHLESSDGGILALNATYGDTSLGAVPASQETNIWVTGSNHTLFNQSGEFTIHSNRTVFVKNGRTFFTGAQTDARLVFGGMVKGEADDGLEYPTTTALRVRDTWAGTTVLSPGKGRTNEVGRLVVLGNLEITNGVTMVASATAGTSVDAAMLYVSAGSTTGTSETKGRLLVRDGGVISTPQTALRYAVTANGGHADICGGTVDMPNVEWINAYNRPCLTTVRDGGVMDVGTFRVAQATTDSPTVVRLGTNGLLRCNQISIDTGKTTSATFLFDGGAIQSAAGYSAADDSGSTKASFVKNSSNAKWDGITFAIGPGGAVFDTDNDKHLYWHRPLVKAVAGEPDGGITVRGNKDKSVIFYKDLEYNGPTTVDGACTLQLRDGSLPTGTKLVLKNGGKAGFSNYDKDHTPTPATLDSIEGDGTLTWCRGITVTNAIVPSIGGTITLHEACTLDGVTLEIAGDATGCGKVKFDEKQDISELELKIVDISKFDREADSTRYKIVDAPKEVTGKFKKVHGLPDDDWKVKYAKDGVYVYRRKGLLLIIR